MFEQQQEWRKVKQYLDRVLELEPVPGGLKKSAHDVAARQIQVLRVRVNDLPVSIRMTLKPFYRRADSRAAGDELLAKQKAQEALALNPDHVESN